MRELLIIIVLSVTVLHTFVPIFSEVDALDCACVIHFVQCIGNSNDRLLTGAAH